MSIWSFLSWGSDNTIRGDPDLWQVVSFLLKKNQRYTFSIFWFFHFFVLQIVPFPLWRSHNLLLWKKNNLFIFFKITQLSIIMLSFLFVTLFVTTVVSNGFKLPSSKGKDVAVKSTISGGNFWRSFTILLLHIKSSLEFLDAYAVPPTGYFDPLRLSAGKSEDTMKKWREAELKHGRVCMLASLGILVQESFHPMFGGNIVGPAINHFQQVQALYPPFWYLILGSISIAECWTITKVIVFW